MNEPIANVNAKESLKAIEKEVKALVAGGAKKVMIVYFEAIAPRKMVYEAIEFGVENCFLKSGKFPAHFNIGQYLASEGTKFYSVEAAA